MDTDLLLKALIALTPVLVLLFVFDRLDVFNLITMRVIALLLVCGGSLAALSWLANWSVMDGFPIGLTSYSRYVAPVIEESLKALPIVILFAANRIGFKLDAAIAGFAVGAGFSVIENIWYLNMITDANVSAWLVRGFGTAVMHGGATALFALISHEMTERQAASSAARYRFNPLPFVPGLLAAMAVHSAFNHFPHQPILIMAATMLLIPLTVFMTLTRSERATQQWLKADEAAHRQALEDIRSGRFAESEAGQAIRQSVARFGAAASDATAYVELKMELVLRAEELIHASQAGAAIEVGQAEREKFERLDELELRLGKLVTTAINSRLGFTRNDLWELGRLRARAKGAA
jgi:protease PrsW